MTARPLQPDELLDLADRLVGRAAGPGRPRTIELRRGVSTAYYAVFHELAFRGTEALLQDPSGNWSSRAASVSRWVTHAALRELSEVVTGARTNGALRDALGSVAPEVVRIGDAFVSLQQARHRADYDDQYDLRRAVALAHAQAAREAVDLSVMLVDRADPSYGLFLRLMLGASQAKSRRS